MACRKGCAHGNGGIVGNEPLPRRGLDVCQDDQVLGPGEGVNRHGRCCGVTLASKLPSTAEAAVGRHQPSEVGVDDLGEIAGESSLFLVRNRLIRVKMSTMSCGRSLGSHLHFLGAKWKIWVAWIVRAGRSPATRHPYESERINGTRSRC